MITKTYLGDSVYCEYNDGIVIIYLNNKGYAENLIVLEPEVLSTFIEFIQRKREEQSHNAKT